LIVGVIATAVVLSLLAGFAHEWLLTFDEPVSDWLRSTNDSDVWRAVSVLGSEWLALAVLGGLAVLLRKVCKPVAIGLPAVVVVAAIVNISLKLVTYTGLLWREARGQRPDSLALPTYDATSCWLFPRT
jgi:hypothetical protein